jgi:hypothetical protein
VLGCVVAFGGVSLIGVATSGSSLVLRRLVAQARH